MERIEPWQREAQALDEVRFRTRHCTPALLLRWVVEGDIGRRIGHNSTLVHNVRGGLKERLAAGEAVADRRPIKHERLVPVAHKVENLSVPHRYAIGRRRGADMFINDYTVSAHHGSLLWMPKLARWMFIDEMSTNGTWLNGVRLPSKQRALLNSCDELQLGRMVFLYLEPGDLHRYLVGNY